jgi:hypothetical protein
MCKTSTFKPILMISELCKMIEDSIHSGKYPLDDDQKRLAHLVKVVNASASDDLKSSDIKIEVRIQNLYTLSNYLPNMEHLPGVIEIDILDSFKILSRRLQRLDKSNSINNTTIARPRLSKSSC